MSSDFEGIARFAVLSFARWFRVIARGVDQLAHLSSAADGSEVERAASRVRLERRNTGEEIPIKVTNSMLTCPFKPEEPRRPPA